MGCCGGNSRRVERALAAQAQAEELDRQQRLLAEAANAEKLAEATEAQGTEGVAA